jgi:hypothetical protein
MKTGTAMDDLRFSSPVDSLVKCGLEYNIEMHLEIRGENVYWVSTGINGSLLLDHVSCSREVCYSNMIRLLENGDLRSNEVNFSS